MLIISRNGFKLPFLGKDKFIKLVRNGLGYDKTRKLFFIEDFNNIDQIRSILSEILPDDVLFKQECIICHRKFECKECEFKGKCETENVPMLCVCNECYHNPDFVEKFFSNL